jgi:hypothetical protein
LLLLDPAVVLVVKGSGTIRGSGAEKQCKVLVFREDLEQQHLTIYIYHLILNNFLIGWVVVVVASPDNYQSFALLHERAYQKVWTQLFATGV